RMAWVDSLLRLPEVRRYWPRGSDLRWSTATEGGSALLYALEGRPIITGTSLESARAQLDPLTGGAEVAFELDRAGGRRFGDVTGRHVGDYLAIMLDGRVQGRPPVIESRIDRHGRIQLGGRTLAEASDLALVLRAGALPTPLTVVEQYEIGPSLGEDSIRGGIQAGIAGSVAVVAIVVGYYGWSGVLAVLALAIYALLCLGAIALFGGALTLPGLAGFVLSVGMAVDANVLIFERIREERQRGTGLRAAIGDGFRHALPAIIDSNLTTLLTALFLFRFGTGPVQGFAVTLSVGIVASMFTAVFVTRTLYLLWLKRAGEGGRLSIGRWRLFHGSSFRFFERRRWAYAATALLLVVGLAVGAGRGIRYGVDFTGGTASQVETAEPVDLARVRAGLLEHGIEGAEVQRLGGDRGLVVRAGPTTDLDGRRAAVAATLDQAAGPGQYTVLRTEGTSPKVGEELQAKALTAILLSFAGVLAYLAFRFEWRFGIAAVVATAHDILATLAFIAILDIEVSLVVVAALLTVVGYSLNDTIVIFDRVRETLHGRRPRPTEALLDRSVNETLPRTVMTGGTALACLVALAVFGGAVIRPFAMVMFFGIFVGTFSSVFVASPVLAWIHERWPATRQAGATSRDGSASATVSVAPRAGQ
ncbi:MAG: protein translocase subunit SecF, partial [Gemmatimonadales bacterium]